MGQFANFLITSPFLQITNPAGLGGTNVTFSLPNPISGGYNGRYSTQDLVNWYALGPATPFYSFLNHYRAPASPKRFYRLYTP